MNVWYLKIGKWIYCFGKISYETFKKLLVMGSHFIKVGKLNIDKYILDLACPAAGYDETPPPPEIYCPANGYVDPNETGQDLDGFPEVTPTPGEDEIIVIIADYYPVSGNISVYRSSGNLFWELYGEGDVLLDSGNQSSYLFAYNSLLLSGGYVGNGAKFYKYVFRPAEGEHITAYSGSPATTVKIFINAPLIESITIYTLSFLNELWLCDTLDSLTSATYLCQYTPELRNITLPSSMASITTLESWLRESGITELIWECDCPQVINLKYLGYRSKIRNAEIDLTIGDAVNVSAQGLLDGAEVFSAIINLTNLSNVDGAQVLQNCKNLKYFKLSSNFYFNSGILANSIFADTDDSIFELYPPTLKVFNNQPMLTSNVKIKKIIFGENHWGCLSGIAVIAASAVEEVVFLGTETGTTGTFFSVLMGSAKIETLKKITLSPTISAPNLSTKQITFWYLAAFYPNLEELSSFVAVDFEFTQLGTGSTSVIFTKLKRFDQPALYFITNMNLNRTSASPGSLEYFDIDFEESFIKGCSTTVNFAYQQFDATELNRIFTKFPNSAVATGTGVLRIQVTGCPGAATCDKSIVEAKGWTVLT